MNYGDLICSREPKSQRIEVGRKGDPNGVGVNWKIGTEFNEFMNNVLVTVPRKFCGSLQKIYEEVQGTRRVGQERANNVAVVASVTGGASGERSSKIDGQVFTKTWKFCFRLSAVSDVVHTGEDKGNRHDYTGAGREQSKHTGRWTAVEDVGVGTKRRPRKQRMTASRVGSEQHVLSERCVKGIGQGPLPFQQSKRYRGSCKSWRVSSLTVQKTESIRRL